MIFTCSSKSSKNRISKTSDVVKRGRDALVERMTATPVANHAGIPGSSPADPTWVFHKNIIVSPLSMWLGDHVNDGLVELRCETSVTLNHLVNTADWWHWPDAGLMLARRHRRHANIKPASGSASWPLWYPTPGTMGGKRHSLTQLRLIPGPMSCGRWCDCAAFSGTLS